MKRLSLKLVESIRYHYSLRKPVAETVQLIWSVIAEIKGFVKESTSYTVLATLKRKEEKDWTPISIISSFLEKLGKGKGYIPVKNLEKVKNSYQIFKVFEERVFDKEIHILVDISDILGSLSGRESPELERVNWVTKDYNLRSRSKLSEVTKTLIPKIHNRKKRLTLTLTSLLSLFLVIPVVLINQLLIPDGNGH